MSEPLDQLYSEVGALTGVGRVFLKGDSRLPRIVAARAVAILVMRDQLGMTWEAIAAELNRSHSSVIELAEKYRTDRDVMRDVQALSESQRLQFQQAG